MELELGLKITKTREDVSSSIDFRFSKDPFGPLVLSRETDSRFIIIIHLKGFKREGIDIEINDEGNRIIIRGRKPVEEMVLIRWMAWRKEVELRVFRKVFRIPDIVDLDKIKARFDDDDATLTITMPKRVKGISGFKIEEEEEDKERVDFGDVSEAEKTEEIQSGEEVEGAKIEETEDDHLEAIQQIEEKDKILEFVRDQTSQKELVDSNTESEDKIQDSCEQTRHEEQGDNQVETKSEDFGSRALEEIEEQEPEEQLDRTSKSKSMEKEITDDDDDSLRKVKGIQEPKRRNEEYQIQEMVEEETGDHEKKEVVKMEVKSSDAKEEIDEKLRERFTPNIERTQAVGDDDKAETETKAEELKLESDKPKADEIDKRDALIDKQEEEKKNATKVRREGENVSLIKLQEETGEQHSKGQKRNNKQEKRKELVEQKTPLVKKDIGNDIPKLAQETEVPKVDTLANTSDEGKEGEEKRKNVKMEKKTGVANEAVDAKMSERITPNIAETETKAANEFGSHKLEADELDELVGEKDEREENAEGGTQNEDNSSIKLQEIGEQKFQRQKRHDKQENIKKLMEEKTSKTETNIENDTLKPVQERCERNHKNQAEDCKEKIMETGKKINETGMRKIQELNEPARREKESKTRELEKRKTNDEEKKENRISEVETEELNSCRPKVLEEHEEEKVSKNKKNKEEEKIAKKKAESGDDDGISKKVGDIEQQDLNAKEEVGAEMGEGFTPNMTDTETKAEELEFAKLEPDEENDKVIRQNEDNSLIKELQETGEQQFQEKKRHDKQENIKELVEEIVPEEETNIGNEILKPVQEIKEPHVDTLEGSEEEEIAEMKTKEQESYIPKVLSDQNKIQELVEHEKTNFSRKVEEEEEISEKKTEFGDDDMSKEVEDIEQRNRDATKREKEKGIIQELALEEKVSDNGKELLKEKTDDHEKEEDKEIVESAIEAEHGSLRKVDDIQPKIHKERDKTRIIGAEEPRGQEKEENESQTITENENSTNIQKIKEERPYKPESHRKRYKIQEVVEEEQQEEKVIEKEELVTEKDSSKKAQEIEKHGSDELNRSMAQNKMQQTEEKDKTNAMEENEVVEKRAKTKDGDKRKEENKFPEPLKMSTSGYTEKLKKQDTKRADLHDFERLGKGKQSNIPKSVEEEKVENTEDDSSGMFHEAEKEKSYEDWIHEEREKRKGLVKKEATNRKDKHNGREGRNDHKEQKQEEQLQEIANQECDELQRSMVQDKKQETEESRAMEEEEILERRKKTKDGSLRKVQEGGDHKRHGEEESVETEISDHREKVKKQDERERHCKQRKIHQMVEDEKGEGKMEGHSSGKFEKQEPYEDCRKEESEAIEHLVKEEATDVKDNHSGEHEKERYEKVPQTKTKPEEEILSEGVSDGEKQNLVDYFPRKIEETEKEESQESERHEKLDIVQDFVEDETEDQEDEKAEEAIGVVAKNENGSSRKIQTINEQELEESEKHKEQNKIPETSDPKVIEDEYEERASEKETKEQEAHVQELKEITEDRKDGDGEKGKKGKTVETISRDIVRKIQQTKVQDSQENKNQEPEDKIEALEKKEKSNDEVNPLTKDDDDDDEVFLGKESSNLSNRRLVDQEKIPKLLKEEEKREDKEKPEVETKINNGKSRNYETYESEENKELNKIREPMEEKTKGLEKVAEEETQDKIENRNEDQEIKRTKDGSSRKVEKIVAQEPDGLEELLREGASDGENGKKNLVDDFTRKIQETEKEESERREKLDIDQDFVEDETEDQEDVKAEEVVGVVAKNENGRSRKIQKIDEQEVEHKEQKKIPETSDPKVIEDEDEEKAAAKKETKEQDAHVQELEEKTDNFKDDDGEKCKQWKTLETKSDRKIRETNLQESNEKTNQEPEDKIEELEKKETSNHEVNPVAVDDADHGERRRGEKGKQGKTVGTKSDDDIVRKIRETKVQESKEKKNQEPEDKIEELERKQTSNHEVNPVTEDDDVSKRRPVDQEKVQKLLKEEEKREGKQEKAEVETKINDGKSRNFETYKMLETDESEANKELNKIREPMEKKTKGLEKIAEDEIQDKIGNRIKEQENKGQEPYELLKNRELDKIPEYHREEEKAIEEMKKTEDVSSRKVERIVAQESDDLEKHQKLSEIKEKMIAGGRSDQPEIYTQEEYDTRENREQQEKGKRDPQIEAKANDDSSKKNETERLRRQENQELVEIETSDQMKEYKEEEVVEKAKTKDEYDEQNSDKLEEMSTKLAEEETSNDKEGNRAGHEGFGKVREVKEQELAVVVRHREQDRKQTFVGEDTSGKAKEKENKNQGTKSRDDSSRKTQENEKQESREQRNKKQSFVEKDTKENENQETKSRDDSSRKTQKQEFHEERDKKNMRPNYSINEEDGKEDKQISEAKLPRTLKGIENLVEEKTNNQQGEDKKSMITKVSAKAKDHESKAKSKDNESRNSPHINEQDRLEEQGRITELVKDRTHYYRETEFHENGGSKKIQEVEKEEGIDEKRDKIQVRETSEDDEEELEVEYEDSEEDWDAQVIQETDSDEDNDKIRQISRIKLGFRLVGGSALFMSLIVIVIRFIRSKKKIKCYKF